MVAMTGRRVAAVACAGALAVAVGSASTRAASPSRSTARVAASPAAAAQPVAGARVIGRGTARSCTSSAVVAAVRAGGRISFSCGTKPVTIRMRATAKVLNTRREVVLDGGGLVTLSGEGRRRILYMDTCDPAQVFTTSHCQDQATPRLVVENLTFADGNSSGEHFDGGGGGAIFARGGRLRIVHSTFIRNRCDPNGPDVGGGAVRALSAYRSLPVDVIGSRFTANVCSNGGALSSIGVSWNVADSRFVRNRAIGRGANPARPGTPGGGSGGAIYNDGNRFKLTITGSRSPTTAPRRAAGRSSSSATTAPARWRSRTASWSAIAATDSRPPVCRASSSWAPAGRRSSTPSCAERTAGRGGHRPAVTALSSSSESRTRSGRVRSFASSTQRSTAILKTAIPASAVRLAAASLTPRWRNAPARAERERGELDQLALAELRGGGDDGLALSCALAGWRPTHPGLIDDLDQGHYFHNGSG